jgi:hypothetical protein
VGATSQSRANKVTAAVERRNAAPDRARSVAPSFAGEGFAALLPTAPERIFRETTAAALRNPDAMECDTLFGFAWLFLPTLDLAPILDTGFGYRCGILHRSDKRGLHKRRILMLCLLAEPLAIVPRSISGAPDAAPTRGKIAGPDGENIPRLRRGV